MTVIIGLTGGIASGKSTVARMFLEKNIPVIDADQIAREVVEPGEKTLKKIVETFGDKIINSDGTLNRQKLGKIIFTNKAKREQLNEIIHPAIRHRMLKQCEDYIAKEAQVVVLDIPLLFESELTHLVDQVLVIYVDEDTQLDRLMKRDLLTCNEAKQRIRSQLPLQEKAQLADAVINNNNSIKKTAEQLDDILEQWNIYT